MQKRCGEDQVCGVLRFQAGLACRISRGVSGLRQHAWRGEKGQRSLTEQAACTRSCPREAAKRQSKPCSLSRWGGREASTQAASVPQGLERETVPSTWGHTQNADPSRFRKHWPLQRRL